MKRLLTTHPFPRPGTRAASRVQGTWAQRVQLVLGGIGIAAVQFRATPAAVSEKKLHDLQEYDLNKPAKGTTVFEDAATSFAPHMPAAIKRREPATVRVHMKSEIKDLPVSPRFRYRTWTFNGDVPGPFIRVRVGDTLEVHHTNNDLTGMPHNIDFHAVAGPGGGAVLLQADSGQTKIARFKLQHPGLFIYHCAAAPVPVHIANGMYGLLLVEPEQGLPAVDKEYYVMQSEFYPLRTENPELAECDYPAGLSERPETVVFNGRENALVTKPLTAKTGDRVRLFVGNIGPNLVSSFHVLGCPLSRVYREGDLISEPARSVQTTLIPAGGASVVDLQPTVPGTYTLIDHSIFRMDKGAVGFLNVIGPERPDLFTSPQPRTACQGCKLHA